MNLMEVGCRLDLG